MSETNSNEVEKELIENILPFADADWRKEYPDNFYFNEKFIRNLAKVCRIALTDKFHIIPKSDNPEKHVEVYAETEVVPLSHKDYWKKIIKLKWRGEK